MYNYRLINKKQFAKAKRLFGFALIVKILIFVIGLYGLSNPSLQNYLPLMILLLSLTSETFSIISDKYKSQGEKLLRALDLRLSFGSAIPKTIELELNEQIAKKKRKEFTEEEDTYFASTAPAGPKKALENLRESSWYSKKEANTMLIIYNVLTITLITLSLIAVIIASKAIMNPEIRNQTTNTSTSFLMLLISLWMIKGGYSYFKMREMCDKFFISSDSLLKHEINEEDAKRLWNEYHLYRATFPLLPEWLWKLKGESLERAWNTTYANIST